ncbi:GvpL/GvpF family gas vesicle protein [Streptomyces sp. B93]|uniref:GvpL/GvpF family gas vesicle protein n=1 Tax=Streptomyces sp. B93 TaxID=2824875 RepID=UPI001B36CEBC|nr:GvpL/GvpF family gas vesicle protein [Streptomyces sp. B93]MBQ1090702.1 GvpL/GvpF family gas vesicle protein [Streptomyces sp. B93]
MTGQLTYVYAVVPASAVADPGALTGLHGVAGAPVAHVRSGALAAVVGTVPAGEFSEAALKSRLEDLDWLETTARAHHSVIEALAARTTVLPLRLATVYLDEARVAAMLGQRETAFTTLLERFADHEEWGVKVYAESAPPAAPAPVAHSGPDAGRAYLRSRRRLRQEREDTWRSAQEAVRRTEELARAVAVERARHRPQQGDLAQLPDGTGGTAENVANDAYLVPRHLAGEFRDRMRHAADGLPGVRVEVTGPWAPYSFAAPPAQEEVPQR